jgi:DNA-binding PadR family transcriptional regulator
MQSPVHWALLGLVIEQPSYGYELAQRFERAYGGMLDVSGVSYIYTALKALEQRSLVEELAGRGGARQPKPCYRATTEGVRAYQECLVEQLREDGRRWRLLARQLAVFAHEPQIALEIIDRCARACLQQAADTSLGDVDGARISGVAGLAARLEAEESRLAIEARLPWLQYARREFEALAKARRTDDGAA